MCSPTLLTVIGGVCEVGGFLLVSIDLYLLQRDEFGPLWIERTFAACRVSLVRLWRKITRQTPTVHYGSARGTVVSGGSAHGTVRAGTDGKYLEERVEALEFNFRELDKEVDRQRVKLNHAVDQVQADLDAAIGGIQEQQKAQKEEERIFRRRSLRFQGAGIPLFLLGVAFSVAGSIVTC